MATILGEVALVGLFPMLGVGACGGEIRVGSDPSNGSCPADAGDELAPLPVPWSTGFENGFGDWDLCYMTGGGVFPQIVSSPVHGGAHAAQFSLTSTRTVPAQSRCKKTGSFPQSAYYGAWYYVPTAAANLDNWNLLHFEGSNTKNGSCILELWDVSLVGDGDAGLRPSVYDFLSAGSFSAPTAIPIAQWFHLETYWRRASDATGEFDLFVDGKMLVSLSGIATDDTTWGEWHVGNLATALSPPMSTVYVDDVSIGPSGP